MFESQCKMIFLVPLSFSNWGFAIIWSHTHSYNIYKCICVNGTRHCCCQSQIPFQMCVKSEMQSIKLYSTSTHHTTIHVQCIWSHREPFCAERTFVSAHAVNTLNVSIIWLSGLTISAWSINGSDQ